MFIYLCDLSVGLLLTVRAHIVTNCTNIPTIIYEQNNKARLDEK